VPHTASAFNGLACYWKNRVRFDLPRVGEAPAAGRPSIADIWPRFFAGGSNPARATRFPASNAAALAIAVKRQPVRLCGPRRARLI
jgi:hypothetical protein